MLTDIVEQIEQGRPMRTLKGGQIDLGTHSLPQIPRASGDRNRTSPFAFTGNKFEFRAVGSGQSVAWPVTVLNTIAAESLDYVATRLEAAVGLDPEPARLTDAAIALVRELVHEHKRIIFNGDGYTQEWHAEAERRGLPNLRDCISAIPVMVAEKNLELFEKYKVMTRTELESREHIYIELYAKQLLIESEAMVLVGRQLILPAVLQHQTLLAQTVTATAAAGDALDAADNHQESDPFEHARYFKGTVLPLMAELRGLADQLETQVASNFWPLPSYRELLFIK
jgi:glutamine synthetase